ncbi:MAG: Ig-like domain-containing protein, partial [Pseudomonadota bacterium]
LPSATDPDGDTGLTYAVSGTGLAGLALDTDGSFTYQPPENLNGDVSFDYVVSDPGGATSDPQTFTFTINPINDAPIAAGTGNAASLDEDTTLDGALPSATDPDGDTGLTYAVSGAGLAGLALDSDGSFTYQPPEDLNGDVSFDYAVSDPGGATSAPQTFTFTINPVNDAPIAAGSGNSAGLDEDTVLNGALPAANDPDGDTVLTYAISGAGLIGLTLNANGSFTYAPPENLNGATSFSYVVSDQGGVTSDPQTFTFAINAVNDAPILVNALADRSADAGTSLNFALPSDAFTDVDGDALTWAAALASGDPLPSWLSFDPDTFSFSGLVPGDANETIQIRVSASDGEFSADDVFDLAIVGTPNQAPTAGDDTGFETAAGDPLAIDWSSLLTNDTDPDGDAVSVQSVQGAVNGSVEIVDGQAVFTPNDGFTGAASFEYTITDGDLTTTATVFIEVTGSRYDGFVQGTDGRDWLFGRFFQENQIFGADGPDRIFGGFRDDELAGGNGNDSLFGSAGDDILEGNAGNDRLYGSFGEDVLDGGTGRDRLTGGLNDDVFIYAEGYGRDRIIDFGASGANSWFRGDDIVQIDVDGVDTFDDLVSVASGSGRHVSFDFGDGDVLTLRNTRLSDLSDSDFVFL